MKRFTGLLIAVCAFGIIACPPSARAQEKIRVFCDGPLRQAMLPVGELFRRDSGHEVEYVFGPSPVIHKKVADGETADVLIIQPDFVAELVKSGKVVPGEHPVIGRVGFGLAARADAAPHNVDTVEAFRQVLLNADSLIFNNVASGNYFATVLERLGIAEAVKTKIVRVPPAALFERIKQGKGNAIGVGTIPQIVADKDLRLIGPLPAGLQNHIAYAAAPMSSAASPGAARAFIAFLLSPAAKSLLTASAVEAGDSR